MVARQARLRRWILPFRVRAGDWRQGAGSPVSSVRVDPSDGFSGSSRRRCSRVPAQGVQQEQFKRSLAHQTGPAQARQAHLLFQVTNNKKKILKGHHHGNISNSQRRRKHFVQKMRVVERKSRVVSSFMRNRKMGGADFLSSQFLPASFRRIYMQESLRERERGRRMI